MDNNEDDLREYIEEMLRNDMFVSSPSNQRIGMATPNKMLPGEPGLVDPDNQDMHIHLKILYFLPEETYNSGIYFRWVLVFSILFFIGALCYLLYKCCKKCPSPDDAMEDLEQSIQDPEGSLQAANKQQIFDTQLSKIDKMRADNRINEEPTTKYDHGIENKLYAN